MPVSALSEGGVPPEEGDTVQYSVEGKVQSVSGATATVEIDSVNGEPVGEESSESPEEEGQEPETGTEQGGGGPSGSASGASPATIADKIGNPLAPMGGVAGRAPLRSRMDRAGTDLMRNRLLKGARGKAMPF